jgi:phage terminase large subunit-like protein
VSVQPAGRSDVYDLTVDGAHEFFASGILVHNCDEIGLWLKWETTWDESLKYALRQGISRIIATGTPKVSRPAAKLIRRILRGSEPGGAIVRRLRTVDNRANLSEEFFRAVVGSATGTRLERQELEGELLDDVANSLWVRDQIDAIRCAGVGQAGGPAFLREVKIGVDPSDGTETSDEQAYTVVGLGPGDDEHIYVAENWGGQESPAAFTRRVLKRAQHWGQNGCSVEIVLEKNHGGEWLIGTFRQVMKDLGIHVKVKIVHASQAKRTRAEPVSAMYERRGGGLVRHCHTSYFRPCDCADIEHPEGHRVSDEHMPELEDQMCTFTGAARERSPDRLDSLVWAASQYLTKSIGPPLPAGRVPWAAGRELEMAGVGPEQASRERRLASAHGGAYKTQAQWDLEDFAPLDDGDHPQRPVPANVVAWH